MDYSNETNLVNAIVKLLEVITELLKRELKNESK
jgi:hypothetical protein